jgi:hypothetical protein
VSGDARYVKFKLEIPVFRGLESPDSNRLVGEPITFEASIADLDSPSVALMYGYEYESQDSSRILLYGVHPSPFIVVTAPSILIDSKFD